MYKCLIKGGISQKSFFNVNIIHFSKKFIEKREKIRHFLSKEKSDHKLEMLQKQKEFTDLKEKEFEKKFTKNDNETITLKKLKNIISDKCAKYGFIFIKYLGKITPICYITKKL